LEKEDNLGEKKELEEEDLDGVLGEELDAEEMDDDKLDEDELEEEEF
jgi:hypothetical protein